MGEATTITWAELLPGDGLMSTLELKALPPDRWRYELVAGRQVRMPATELRHEVIAHSLQYALRRFVTGAELGTVSSPQTGFVVSGADQPDTFFRPALAFVRTRQPSEAQAQAAVSTSDAVMRVVPDLVVEIAASGQQRAALAEKTALWLAAGVKAVWVIWPARRQVDCWHMGAEGPVARTLSADERLDGDDVVPGFSYLVAHLFL